MKKFLALICISVSGFCLSGCDGLDDLDDLEDWLEDVPVFVEDGFIHHYPGYRPGHWWQTGGYFKTEFRDASGREVEAWFNSRGEWVRSETEWNVADLPLCVLDYLDEGFPGFRIDDVEFVQTLHDEYFKIELERKGYRDIEVCVYPDGTPVKAPSHGGR